MTTKTLGDLTLLPALADSKKRSRSMGEVLGPDGAVKKALTDVKQALEVLEAVLDADTGSGAAAAATTTTTTVVDAPALSPLCVSVRSTTLRLEDLAHTVRPLPGHKFNEDYLRRMNTGHLGSDDQKRHLVAYGRLPCAPLENLVLVGDGDPEYEGNAFIGTLTAAQDRCQGVVYPPDVAWHLIVQAVARHINANSEALRKRLVDHADQKELVVGQDWATFSWTDVFGQFGVLIKANTHPTVYGRLQDNKGFGTTGRLETAALNVAVMDAFQKYFKYTAVIESCSFFERYGIPFVKVQGTKADWEAVRARAANLGPLLTDELKQAWLPALDSVLKEFVGAAAGIGPVNVAFWKRMVTSKPGRSDVDGWANVFFPELQPADKLVPNKWMSSGVSRPIVSGDGQGWQIEDYPSDISKTPMKLVLDGPSYDLTLHGGIVAVSQDAATGALCPRVGWFVTSEKPIPNMPPRGAGEIAF